MGNGSSTPEREDENGIDFNDTTTDVIIPPDPVVGSFDPNISENIEGATAISVTEVKSEYNEIKDAILARSRETGKNYVYKDQTFPAERRSLYYSSRAPPRWDDIVWKRPNDISRNPRLITGNIGSEDVVQGQLGDCWFLASCAAISRSPKFMKKVVPSDQEMSGPDYVGMFHFRFWRFGSWVDVIVDDNLPTLYGQLSFSRSADNNEFWLPLVEKAYAKLNESYQAIEGGFTQDGMEDLTGGIAVNYELRNETPDHLFRTLHKALRHDSFVCAGIGGSSNVEDRRTGLVSAHAYALLRAVRVAYEGDKVDLIKLRNPWGGKVEWKGSWSDDSTKWDSMDQATKDYLGFAAKDDGEWWMTYDDFIRHFHDVTICSVGPDFDNDGAPTGDRWLLSTVKGQWIPGVNAGGSRNSISSYTTNPQYFLELREPDDFDPAEDDPSEEGKCSVIIGLMQEYRRLGRADGLQNLHLGLNLFKVREKPREKLDRSYFSYNREIAKSGTYINRREVTITAELLPGNYVIVPSTFNSGDQGSFLLRIYTEKRVDLEELR